MDIPPALLVWHNLKKNYDSIGYLPISHVIFHLINPQKKCPRPSHDNQFQIFDFNVRVLGIIVELIR